MTTERTSLKTLRIGGRFLQKPWSVQRFAMPWQMPWLCSKNTTGAFVLRDVKELSITETANVLGITRGAVKTRLRRARLMLRDILLPELQQRGQVALAFKEARKPWELSCEEVWREISDYVDHKLDAKRRTALEEH